MRTMTTGIPLRNATATAVHAQIREQQPWRKCQTILVSWPSRHCLHRQWVVMECGKEKDPRNAVAVTAAMTAAVTIVAATVASPAAAVATAASRVAAAATNAAAPVAATAATAAHVVAIAAVRSQKMRLKLPN